MSFLCSLIVVGIAAGITFYFCVEYNFKDADQQQIQECITSGLSEENQQQIQECITSGLSEEICKGRVY